MSASAGFVVRRRRTSFTARVAFAFEESAEDTEGMGRFARLCRISSMCVRLQDPVEPRLLPIGAGGIAFARGPVVGEFFRLQTQIERRQAVTRARRFAEPQPLLGNDGVLGPTCGARSLRGGGLSLPFRFLFLFLFLFPFPSIPFPT